MKKNITCVILIICGGLLLLKTVPSEDNEMKNINDDITIKDSLSEYNLELGKSFIYKSNLEFSETPLKFENNNSNEYFYQEKDLDFIISGTEIHPFSIIKDENLTKGLDFYTSFWNQDPEYNIFNHTSFAFADYNSVIKNIKNGNEFLFTMIDHYGTYHSFNKCFVNKNNSFQCYSRGDEYPNINNHVYFNRNDNGEITGMIVANNIESHISIIGNEGIVYDILDEYGEAYKSKKSKRKGGRVNRVKNL